VAPGDVIRVEKVGTGTDGLVEFPVVAVSGEEGKVGQQSDARVVGEIVEEGPRREDPGVSLQAQEAVTRNSADIARRIRPVRISEIAFDGQSFKAPELPKKEAKPKKVKSARTARATSHPNTRRRQHTRRPRKTFD